MKVEEKAKEKRTLELDELQVGKVYNLIGTTDLYLCATPYENSGENAVVRLTDRARGVRPAPYICRTSGWKPLFQDTNSVVVVTFNEN